MQVSTVELRRDLFRFLDEVHKTHKEVTITKRGRPIAKLVHMDDSEHSEKDPLIGALKGLGKTLDDLTQPVIDADDWEVD